MHGDARSMAQKLGGEVSGQRIRCPGPGHSKHDRSMWVMLDWQAPDGFIVGSFCGDPFDLCRDHVRAKLGLPAWQAGCPKLDTLNATEQNPASRGVEISTPDDRRRSELALAIFKEAKALDGTLGERYLRNRLGARA